MEKGYFVLCFVIWFYASIFCLCGYIGIHGIEIEWDHFVLIAIAGIPVSIAAFKLIERKEKLPREVK